MNTKSTKQDKVTDGATKAAETIVAAGQETIRNFAKASTESYENAFAGMRTKAEGLVEGYDEIAASGKESIEAWSAASTAYGKGVEAIGGEWLNFAKKMLDENVQVTKAIMGAKSLNEVMDLQSEFVRGSFDGLMAQSTKVGELATKVAQDAVEPINAQFTTTVEKWHNKTA
ncbi:MAG: phasin family protein [Proteobacteria bacterium]|nr:phasin family protein [Pseudomonadota bacterium]